MAVRNLHRQPSLRHGGEAASARGARPQYIIEASAVAKQPKLAILT